MTSQLHTYGPTCLLYEPQPEHPASQDPNVISPPPTLCSQFFYISPLPIDDPLTPLPTPSGNSASSQAKFPPRPFSVRDNIALEAAWQDLGRKSMNSVSRSRIHSNSRPCSIPRVKNSHQRQQGMGYGCKKRESALGEQNNGSKRAFVDQDILPRSLRDEELDEDNAPRKRHSIPIPRRSKSPKHHRESSPGGKETEGYSDVHSAATRTGRRSRNASVSGSPFIRAPIRHRLKPLFDTRVSSSEPGSTSTSPERPVSASQDVNVSHEDRLLEGGQRSRPRSSSGATRNAPEVSVTVGASRLHQVELPDLQVPGITTVTTADKD